MKKLALVLVLAMSLVFTGCGKKDNTADTGATTGNNTTTENNSSADGKFKAGTYEGTAKGFGGEIKATVELSADKIEKITVVGDSETEGIGSVAVANLPEDMVSKQAVNVDVVSGATVSSNAVIEAVTVALKAAGVDVSTLVAVEDTAEKATETLDVDCVIVGAGGAGLTAALEAKAAGMNVVVVEKMPYAGGNTLKATGGMNAAETSVQKELGIEDTVEQFIEDTMKGGYEVNNIDLVTEMAEKSADAIDWLASIGAPLPEVSFSGGATNKRIHRPEGGAGVGTYLVNVFLENIEKNEIQVLYNTKATEILSKDGAAVGIKAEGKDADYTINAKSVVLATGGFGANEDLYTSYKPELKGFVTTNSPCATGDGIVMAQAIGADTVDMEQIQIHPTVEQTTSIMVTESVRGGGAILVNTAGKRFGDELLTRDVVSANIMAEEGGYAYLVFDQQLRDSLSAIEKYVENDIVLEGATVEELAEKIGADAKTFADTITTWNKAVADQKDEEFGRSTGMEKDISVGPFYAIKIAPGVHHTMGGVKIDKKAQVIGTTGDAIKGLFAAGEVTGGVHGGNRIGGNAVADIVVFGRVAGTNAAEYAK